VPRRKVDYTNYSKEELIAEIGELEKKKEYGLVWDAEREPEHVVLQCKKHLPILKEVKANSVPPKNPNPEKITHILIEGDNFHSLSVLNYTHENSIDVIYIDPPFNTGSTAWVYNNKYVDKEDAFKHSKWVNMMWNRLSISRNLLKPTGILICAIDDYEIQNLRHLLDKIFHEKNRLGTITVVHNPGGRQDDKFIATAHEYMLIYAKDAQQAVVKYLGISDKKLREYVFKDEFGKYKLREFMRSGSNSRRQDRPNMWYPIYINPDTLKFDITEFEGSVEVLPIDSEGIERVWRWGKNTLLKRKEKYIEVHKNGDSITFFVKERKDDNKGDKPKTIWNKSEYSAANGTNELKRIVGLEEEGEKLFDYPKSPFLIKDILKITSNQDSIILDYFAGSGTTGQAVMDLNAEDEGSRQFILCTNNEIGPKRLKKLKDRGLTREQLKMEGVCRKVCYPRVKNLLTGFSFSGKIKTIIFEQKLNMTKMRRIAEIYDEYLETKEKQKDKFDDIKRELKDNTMRLLGITNVTEKQEGFGDNLKYYRTAFVPSLPTDSNKETLTKQSIEMLCLKENTFEQVLNTESIKIFKNRLKYTVILLDEIKIDELKNEISTVLLRFFEVV
jgi:adenine-specific DNA-methyltransferase